MYEPLSGTMAEVYSGCNACVVGNDSPGTREWQRESRCCLVDVPVEDLYPPRNATVYMGASPEVEDDGTVVDHPPEDDSETGCPGGWYRTRWFSSVQRYLRPCSEQGVYSQNRLLDKLDDRLLDEAVAYFESEQSRNRHWVHKQQMANMGKKGNP